MIGSVTGVVAGKRGHSLLIEGAGVGYLVHVCDELLLGTKEGAQLRLLTHLAVRESALELYGFRTNEELTLFLLLIGVSGIGPKSALAILSIAPPLVLEQAIAAGDTSYLTKVSGIGKKSAERIVVELREKVGAPSVEGTHAVGVDADVLAALHSLGYSVSEAREALKRVSSEVVGTEERIRAALQQLSH